MKKLLTAALSVTLPVMAFAQVTPTDSTKPAPFQPILARDHQGLGRVGVHLAYSTDSGLPFIDALIRGGPAADFGLRAGDVIIRIDKNYTATMSKDEISLALHGQPGSGVELTIQREDDPHYIIRAVARRIIRPDEEYIAQPPRSAVGQGISALPRRRLSLLSSGMR